MLNFLPKWLVGFIAFFLLLLNVLFWVSILLVVSFLKLILPPLRGVIGRLILWIAENWIACNVLWMKLTQKTRWDVQGLDGLDYKGWYLVVSNHQSWADIFIMQKLLNRRIPLMKFFLKQELIWVPFMGLAWWALDFPFLRRYSVEYLKNHPEKKGKDFETTRKACLKFAQMPTSVMNYVEGTRFTRGKHKKQQSPYEYLLRPKAGGIALALSVLGDKFHSLLDITIVYPDGIPSFGEFLCGKVRRVIVRAHTIDIPKQFLRGDYENDLDFRASFQQWVQQLWQEKDLQIRLILEESKAL